MPQNGLPGNYTLVLVHVFTTARNCPPIILGVSQQEATRPVALLATGTPTLSPQLHGPLSAVGVLICGLARPSNLLTQDLKDSLEHSGFLVNLLQRCVQTEAHTIGTEYKQKHTQ